MLADIVVNGVSVFHGKLSFLFRRSGMIDKAGCKIAEYAGDDHHTWQKQPEALLAHGVEPWRIGLQDHDDGHMPQIDPGTGSGPTKYSGRRKLKSISGRRENPTSSILSRTARMECAG